MALGIVAYRGATAVGLVGLLRMVPSAVVAPLATPLADRGRRERVLVLVSTIRGVATGAAGIVVGLDGQCDRLRPRGPLDHRWDPLHTRTLSIAPIALPDRARTHQRERRKRDVGFGCHWQVHCWPLFLSSSPESPLCLPLRQVPRWPLRPSYCDCATTLRRGPRRHEVHGWLT